MGRFLFLERIGGALFRLLIVPLFLGPSLCRVSSRAVIICFCGVAFGESYIYV